MADTVLAFFREFGAGRFEAAEKKTAATFRWFGKAIRPEDWSGEKLASYVESSAISASNAREVPAAIIDTWLEDRAARLFDGPLEDGDVVILVDVQRHGDTSTCCVVVGVDAMRGTVVRRIFDPHDLSEALRAIHA